MTKAASFRQADVRRLLRAVAEAGREAVSIEVDRTGRVVIKLASTPDHSDNDNEWDEVLGSAEEEQPPAKRH